MMMLGFKLPVSIKITRLYLRDLTILSLVHNKYGYGRSYCRYVKVIALDHECHMSQNVLF